MFNVTDPVGKGQDSYMETSMFYTFQRLKSS